MSILSVLNGLGFLFAGNMEEVQSVINADSLVMLTLMLAVALLNISA